ncbi:hypothetical protein Ciccas_002190 [Cichlidogyrus casuarinus]|uniref:MH2 domain-containing protein n=1 Tax=Cichlidogyrus casuarinus TaxID=1844966 RepID=A0ABD2QIA8_9PLAT
MNTPTLDLLKLQKSDQQYLQVGLLSELLSTPGGPLIPFAAKTEGEKGDSQKEQLSVTVNTGPYCANDYPPIDLVCINPFHYERVRDLDGKSLKVQGNFECRKQSHKNFNFISAFAFSNWSDLQTKRNRQMEAGTRFSSGASDPLVFEQPQSNSTSSSASFGSGSRLNALQSQSMRHHSYSDQISAQFPQPMHVDDEQGNIFSSGPHDDSAFHSYDSVRNPEESTQASQSISYCKILDFLACLLSSTWPGLPSEQDRSSVGVKNN